jgi:hypothetical protein
MFPHVAPPLITGNVVIDNRPEQIYVAQTAAGKPRIEDNALADSDVNNHWFADDAVTGTISTTTFNPATYITTLEVDGGKLDAGAHAGRVIRLGEQFGVIQNNTANRISVWGQLTDGEHNFTVISNYRPSEGTPAYELLMTRNAN